MPAAGFSRWPGAGDFDGDAVPALVRGLAVNLRNSILQFDYEPLPFRWEQSRGVRDDLLQASQPFRNKNA